MAVGVRVGNRQASRGAGLEFCGRDLHPAALFALITGFEMTMTDFIRQRHSEESDWLKFLAAKRRQKIEGEKTKAKADGSYVDTLLFAQFCDKKEIVKLQFPEIQREALEDVLNKIERLRNNVAHANEYASSRGEAESVCQVVRELLDLRAELQAGTDTRES